MRSATDIAYFFFPHRALSSLFSPRSLFAYATCKTYPRNASRRRVPYNTLSMAHKENSGKKKKEEKPDISKNEGQARIRQGRGRGREGGGEGRVTLRSIEQGNTIKVVRSPEAWRDANPVFHSSSPSLFFLRFRETSTRALRVAQKHPSL